MRRQVCDEKQTCEEENKRVESIVVVHECVWEFERGGCEHVGASY